MQMHPPPFYCVRPFLTTRTISLSLFLYFSRARTFNRDRETESSSSFLPLQETDGFQYLLVHGIFTGARVFRINQEQNGTRFDYRSRVYFRSTLRYHPNFNNNIQLDVLSRHLLRAISSTIFREICLVASFLQSGIREKCRAKFQSSIAKRPLMIKEDDSRRGVKNSNLNRIWNSWFQGIWKSDSRNISTRR